MLAVHFGIKCKKKKTLAKPNNAKKVLALSVRTYLPMRAHDPLFKHDENNSITCILVPE